MRQAFVLQHLHELPSGQDDVKLLGVYSSRSSALAATDRLKAQPGFRAHPHIVDPSASGETQGFYISEYTVDQDHWIEGYVTV